MWRLRRSDVQYRPYLHATMRRLNRSDIQYRPCLYMLPREDSFDQIYNYRPYLLILPCEDSVHQIHNTDTFYICYHEKTQSIRYTIPTVSTYFTMRRLSSSDIQYQPHLHILPWVDSVNELYNTDRIYICYHEKSQSIRYTIPTISIYITMRRRSRSDIQYRHYLYMLPRADSVDPIYNYRPYLPMYPWEDSVDQLYNYRPYLHILPREDSINQI